MLVVWTFREIEMPQVRIRNLSKDVVRRLEKRASTRGNSLENEVRTILTEAARLDFADLRRRAAAIRSRSRTPQLTDSVQLLCENRDR